MSLLEVTGLSKCYGGVVAVSDVSFEIEKGEIVGLMGANGAGKTTLFAMIAGNVAPNAGRIALNGVRIDGMPAHRVNRLGVARTFQIVRPFTGMSVRENLSVAAMYGASRERSPARASASADDMLVSIGLGDRGDVPAGTLTLAERKRLEVGRALATGPTLLLLDEVLAGLTATEVAAAIELLISIKKRLGLTILVVEHVMRALMRLSDRIIVLHQGKKIAEGAPDRIATDVRVQAAYFGQTDDTAA